MGVDTTHSYELADAEGLLLVADGEARDCGHSLAGFTLGLCMKGLF